MVKGIWKEAIGPSAGLVQRHYVEARKAEMNRKNPGIEEKVQAVLSNNSMTANVDWRKAYDKITAKLQSSELTINFRPEDWFAPDKIATTLKYDTYSQMYERSVGDQGENFLKDTKVNSGAERARIDDAITFPAE